MTPTADLVGFSCIVQKLTFELLFITSEKAQMSCFLKFQRKEKPVLEYNIFI